MVLRRIVLALLTAALPACKHRDEASLVKVDGPTSELMRLGDLSEPLLREICRKRVLTIFLASAEPVGTGRLAPGSRPLAQGGDAAKDIAPVMEDAVRAMRAALGRTDPACERLPEADRRHGENVLVAITDGPGAGDSRIEVSWMRAGEGLVETRFFRVESGKVVTDDGRTAWELDVPGSFHDLMMHFLLYDPERVRSDWSRGIRYDQTHYVFKTHGGLLAEAGEAPRLDAVTWSEEEREARRKTAGHVLAFDAHGPDGPLVSQVYRPYWNPPHGCQALAASGDEAKLARSPELYEHCRKTLTEAGSPLGRFARVAAPRAEAARRGGGGEALGSRADGDTLGPRADGDTLGPRADGDTLGPRADGDTLGPRADGETLGPQADGDTLGPLADGETLGSFGAGDTLGVVGPGLLGPGKDLLFRVTGPLAPATPRLDAPDGAEQLGHALSYDVSDVAGVFTFYPIGVVPAVGATWRLSNLVILDSCFGDESILDSLRVGRETSPQWRQADILLLHNPNPMQANAVDYAALNATQYAALPNLYRYAKNGDATARRLVESFERHVRDEGLQGPHVADVPLAHRQVRAYFLQ